VFGSSTGQTVYKDLEKDNKPGFKNTSETDNYAGRTMNIHVNMEYIAETLSKSIDDKDGTAKLYDFLKKLMSGIQNALGNVNNFEVVYNEDTNTFKIIDNTLIPGQFQKLDSENKKIVEFLITADGNKGTNGGSFIHNINFRTKLSNAFATMATVGAQANGATVGEDATALSKWNKGLTDRIIQTRIGSGPEITETTDVDTSYINNIAAFQNIINKTNDATISDAEISSARNASTDIFKTQISAYALKNQNNPKKGITPIGFIPFDLELNMVGLSGPRIYESYTIDTRLLPKSYQDAIQFICSGISHTITNGEWKTTLNSICGPRQEGAEIEGMPKAKPATAAAPPKNNKSITITDGPGLEPIFKVIWNGESFGGDPNAYNRGVFGTCMKSVTASPKTPNGTTKYYNANALKLEDATILEVLQAMRKNQGGKEVNPYGTDVDCPTNPNIVNSSLFATGLFQFIPATLYSNVKAIEKTEPNILNWKYNKENQIKIAVSSLFLKGTLGNYLSGKNDGDKTDLENAVDAVAGIWASMPTAGNIDIGDNTVGKYSGQGGSHTAQEVGQALITSRIQYCATANPNAKTPYKPAWYVSA
jgi:hypothetical protein